MTIAPQTNHPAPKPMPADRTLSKTLRDYYEADRIRYTDDGHVEAYGKTPNSNEVGWWLVAHSREEAWREIH